MMKRWLFFPMLFSFALTAPAEVEVGGLFSDNAVLQRRTPVAVFGSADPGEAVKVSINGVTAETAAGKDGRFLAELPAMEAGGPYELVITGKDNSVVARNVMIGEVWLCSGQSNMWWPVGRNTDSAKILADCGNPQIRFFNVAEASSIEPAARSPHRWELCTPQSADFFSAVGYFFAARLYQVLNVPVGMIGASWSATRIEPWIAPEAYLNDDAPQWNAKRELLLARRPGEFRKKLLNDYFAAQRKWRAEAEKALEADAAIPPPPAYAWQLAATLNIGDPSVIYNGMIAPLVPYTIAGAIWYQGEANLWDSAVYGDLMRLLVSGWRSEFRNSELPFYFVQLAPFNSQSEPDVLPKMWECQAKFAAETPNVDLVEINDTKSVSDIHPPDKRPVGRRLADKALKHTYSRNVGNVDSPRLMNAEIKPAAVGKGGKPKTAGNIIELTFNNTAELKITDGTAIFEIADAAGRWFPANIKIKGNVISLYSDDVPSPCMVRYNWNKGDTASIADAATGLPLGAFRWGSIPERGMADVLAPELADYRLVYRFTPGTKLMSADNRTAGYEVARPDGKPFSRVAIFMHLVKKDGTDQFVCATMDPYADDQNLLGLPTAGTGAIFQCPVSNVEITTNVPGIAAGRFPEGCRIEFFPGNYTPENALKVPGASDTAFDFGDKTEGCAPGYGSYQLHNAAKKQTVFAFNAWQNGPESDLGIGNNPQGNPDWTFAKNASGYSAAYVLVLVK